MCDKVHCIREIDKTNHQARYICISGKIQWYFLKGQRNLYLIQHSWKALCLALDALRRILTQIYKGFYNPKSHWNQRSWKSECPCGSYQWCLFVNPWTDLQFSLKYSVHKVLTYASSEILNGNVRWYIHLVKHVLDIFWSLTFYNVDRNNYRMKFPAFSGRSRETEKFHGDCLHWP